jgi:hypothetical protein
MRASDMGLVRGACGGRTLSSLEVVVCVSMVCVCVCPAVCVVCRVSCVCRVCVSVVLLQGEGDAFF